MLSSSLKAGGDDRSTFGKIPHHNQFCALPTKHWNHDIVVTMLLSHKPREPSEKAEKVEKARKPHASSKRGANPGMSTSHPVRTPQKQIVSPKQKNLYPGCVMHPLLYHPHNYMFE